MALELAAGICIGVGGARVSLALAPSELTAVGIAIGVGGEGVSVSLVLTVGLVSGIGQGPLELAMRLGTGLGGVSALAPFRLAAGTIKVGGVGVDGVSGSGCPSPLSLSGGISGSGYPSLLFFSSGVSSESDGVSGSSGDLDARSDEKKVRRIARGLFAGASSRSSTGNVTVKIDPPPERDSTPIVPPIRSMMDLVMCRPAKRKGWRAKRKRGTDSYPSPRRARMNPPA